MGNSYGKILQENLVGNSCGKILQEILAGNSCGKFLQEILGGQVEGEKSQFKKGSDWWEFSIWNRVMESQPIRIQLRKILHEYCGNSTGNLAGNSVGNAVGNFPITISKPFLKVIFKICNSSRSTSFSLVNVKNSFLKPILNQF